LTGLVRLFLCLLLSLSVLAPAHAHRRGESYVFFEHPEPDVLTGRFEFYVKDLEKALPGTDRNGDERLTEDEQTPAVEAAVLREFTDRLRIVVNGVEHRPQLDRFWLRKREKIAVIDFSFPGLTAIPDTIDATYAWLWDGVEPNHKAFAVIEDNHRTGAEEVEANIVAAFGPGDETQVIDFRIPPRLKVVWTFVKHGAWHIWIGLDHILFIVTLLLPAVLLRKDGEWVPVGDFPTAMKALLRVVTMFTLAHSVTLSLAALDVVRLPSRLIEGTIALSIGVMALNNIKPVFNDRGYLAIFAFGLFHGLGFASVMEPLGLQPAVLLSSLVGFNVGVELGQVVIVAAVFPVLYALRGQPFYEKGILVGGSVLLALVSLYWFAERVLVPVIAWII
jgi:hypothetical protein